MMFLTESNRFTQEKKNTEWEHFGYESLVLNIIDFMFYSFQDSYFCVFVERGFLVLQGQQKGRELRLQSDEKVSLFVR